MTISVLRVDKFHECERYDRETTTVCDYHRVSTERQC